MSVYDFIIYTIEFFIFIRVKSARRWKHDARDSVTSSLMMMMMMMMIIIIIIVVLTVLCTVCYTNR